MNVYETYSGIMSMVVSFGRRHHDQSLLLASWLGENLLRQFRDLIREAGRRASWRNLRRPFTSTIARSRGRARLIR